MCKDSIFKSHPAEETAKYFKKILKCSPELTLLIQSQHIVTRGFELRKQINYDTTIVFVVKHAFSRDQNLKEK